MDNFEFSLAKVPAPHRILKMPMRTYSVGHQLLLERIQSPFVIGGDAGIEHLNIAALICAQTFEQNTATNGDVLARLKLWILEKRIRGIDYADQIQRFQNYVMLGSIGPKVKPGNGGRAPGGPWLLRLAQFLQFQLGKSESVAWNYPYGLAKFEWATYWEAEGSMKIYNSDELAFEKYCEEQDALEAAELAQKEAARA